MPTLTAPAPRVAQAKTRPVVGARWGLAALLTLVGAAPHALAQGGPPELPSQGSLARAPNLSRVLLDRSLREIPARISRIDDRNVWFNGPDEPPGLPPRPRPISDLIAVLAQTPPRAPTAQDDGDPRPRLTVTLTDGQRLAARVAAESESAGTTPAPVPAKDAPLILETSLGPVRVPLDRISSITVGAARSAPASEAPRKDLVLLSNDDRLEGFVESIGAEVSVAPDGAPPASVPLDRIREIRLANPRTSLRGQLAWLADGSVVAIEGLSQPAEGITTARVLLLGTEGTRPLSGLLSVVFDASRVMSLARITPAEVRAAPDRRWTRPPRAATGPAALDAPDVHIPGPMVAEWPLPDAAARFGGEAALARFAEAWGDCTVTIELAGKAPPRRLWSQRLNSSGAASFNVDLGAPGPGRRLRITLESGERGPVQDQVVLRRPLLLLGPDH